MCDGHAGDASPEAAAAAMMIIRVCDGHAGDASPEAAAAAAVPAGRVRGVRGRRLEAGVPEAAALPGATSRGAAPAEGPGGAAGDRARRQHHRPHRRLLEGCCYLLFVIFKYKNYNK